MQQCQRYLVVLMSLTHIHLIHTLNLPPLMLDYTQILNSNGLWDASHMADMPMTPDRMKFDHQVTLSEERDVKLAWNFTGDNITFKLSAQTPGWIGLGIAKDRYHDVGADFAVMGFRGDDNYVTDMHTDLSGMYVIDKVQDVVAEYIWGSDEDTFAIFSRPLVTCDHDEDVEITDDTLRIIWAYGAVDIQGHTPGEAELFPVDSGSRNIKLLNPTVPPLEVDEPDTDISTFEVTVQDVRMEAGEHRHCTIFSFPDISAKNHIIQFEPILTTGNADNVRQITIRECRGARQELFSAQQAEIDCNAQSVLSDCKSIVVNWVIGMSTFTFPEETGYLIGEPETYFMMEIRYVNPQITDFVDSSGLRLYYTPTLRANNAGVLSTGSLVHESQIIPPKSRSFRLQGHCMKRCVQLALKDREEHVTIFAALLHSRELGRRIRVRHFRDGEELPPVAEDNQFYFLHQETQFLEQKVHLKEGDNMIVECTYDTFERNEITYVNNSKGGESCLAFLSYYPKIAQLTACETAPTETLIMSTVGAERPGEMRKVAEEFEWTSQQTREYNDKLLTSQVYVHCGDGSLKGPQPVPRIKKVYTAEHKCRKPVTPTPERQVHQTTTNSSDDNGGNSASSIVWSETLMFLVIFLHSTITFHVNSISTWI